MFLVSYLTSLKKTTSNTFFKCHQIVKLLLQEKVSESKGKVQLNSKFLLCVKQYFQTET